MWREARRMSEFVAIYLCTDRLPGAGRYLYLHTLAHYYEPQASSNLTTLTLALVLLLPISIDDGDDVDDRSLFQGVDGVLGNNILRRFRQMH